MREVQKMQEEIMDVEKQLTKINSKEENARLNIDRIVTKQTGKLENTAIKKDEMKHKAYDAWTVHQDETATNFIRK